MISIPTRFRVTDRAATAGDREALAYFAGAPSSCARREVLPGGLAKLAKFGVDTAENEPL